MRKVNTKNYISVSSFFCKLFTCLLVYCKHFNKSGHRQAGWERKITKCHGLGKNLPNYLRFYTTSFYSIEISFKTLNVMRQTYLRIQLMYIIKSCPHRTGKWLFCILCTVGWQHREVPATCHIPGVKCTQNMQSSVFVYMGFVFVFVYWVQQSIRYDPFWALMLNEGDKLIFRVCGVSKTQSQVVHCLEEVSENILQEQVTENIHSKAGVFTYIMMKFPL